MTEETKTPVKKKSAKKKVATRKRVAKKKVAKKKVATRKPSPKREMTTEEQFEIELSKDSAGFKDTDTETVTARDTADVIAQMNKKNPEGYDAVSIEKKSTGGKPTTAPVAAEPVNAVSKTTVEDKEEKPKRKKSRRLVDVNTFELTEGYDSSEFNFPYSVVLPIGYESFVTMAAADSKSITITEHRGRLKTTLESGEAMDNLVEALVSMVKEDDGNKDKATMLINGIMGSLRRR